MALTAISQGMLLFSFKDFILKKKILFLEGGEGKEEERERNINVWLPLTHPALGTWPITQACALPGNQAGDPFIRRPVLNPLSHTSQGPKHAPNASTLSVKAQQYKSTEPRI